MGRQAGFCSACSAYVWLSPQGECPNGHPPSMLRDVHATDALPVSGGDAAPAAPPVAPVAPPVEGETDDQLPGQYPGQAPNPYEQPYPGQVPAYGPNGLPYGVRSFSWGAFLLPVFWPLAYGIPKWAAIAFATNLLANLAIEFVPAIALPLSLAPIAVGIWIGFVAPREFWRKHPTKMPVQEYNRRQIKWVIIGVILNALLIGCVVAGVLAGLTGLAPDSLP